ncbi:MAG: peptidoglycan DD-metalloendopeptidase family protein [bacterium]
MKERYLAVSVKLMLVVMVAMSAMPAFADLLSDKNDELQSLRAKIDQQQQQLDASRKRSASLKNQVSIIDQQIALAELQLQELGVEIDSTHANMNRIDRELVDAEVQIFDKKQVLRTAIKDAYTRRQTGMLEVVLGSSNLSDLISQLEYISAIENRITTSLVILRDLNEALKAKKGELEAADKQLQQLISAKQLEQGSLNTQMGAKQALLHDATMTEAEYQKKLQDSLLEQQRLQNEIASLAANSRKGELNQGQYSLMWPIPARKISAGFHDQDYVKTFGLRHDAIDIPTPQGTPIRAPASAYVARVRDGGMGYSYIMLDHGNGMVTVYGHVSAIMVSTSQFVPSGGVIGLTGATPGTLGAGWLTTGPHLHFEVWLNGKAQNPLAYLVG